MEGRADAIPALRPSRAARRSGRAGPSRRRRTRLGPRGSAAEHGPDAMWAAVSHGDVIKAILADALGIHLDQFQRIVVDPGSVSVVSLHAAAAVRAAAQRHRRPVPA